MILSTLLDLLLIAASIGSPMFLAYGIQYILADGRTVREDCRLDLYALNETIALQRAKLEQLSRGVLFSESE